MPQCGKTMTSSAPALRAASTSALTALAVSCELPGSPFARVIARRDGVVGRGSRPSCRSHRGSPACGPPPGPSRAPEYLMPRFLRFAIVCRIPASPASPMWLLAIETQSMPALTSPSMSVGSAVKTVPDVCQRNRSGAGFSKFAIAMSAPSMSVPHGAGVARPSRVRQVPAERRAVLAATGDLGRAAVEREVRALALDAKGLVDAAVEQDVAAGEQRPCRGRDRTRASSASPWQLGVEPPVGRPS